MSDEAILLKLKRNFSQDEAVQLSLKLIAELQMEIGILKSEKEELKFKLSKFKTQDVKPKKLWLQEEIVEQINQKMLKYRVELREAEKKAEEWRNKYFSLISK